MIAEPTHCTSCTETTRAARREFLNISRGGVTWCVLRHTFVAVATMVTLRRTNRLPVQSRVNRSIGPGARGERLAFVDLIEANQARAFLVPQGESKRRHARSQRDDRRRLHERILIMATL